ncbi:MAG: tetratricopeptide repeat protein, partial [Hyphomonadaceae bacterium]
REAGAFDRMGLEIGRLAERMDERFVSVETRSAQAIEQIGEQVARMAERFNQRQEQTARDLNDRIIVAEDRMQARLADVVANLRQHADEVEAEERFTTPTQSLADYAARLAPMMDTPVRAGPVHTPPTNFTLPAETPPPPPQEDFAFGELASPTKEETSVAFIDDDAEETHEIAPHAIDLGGDFAADEDDAIIAEDTAAETAAQPDPFDVDPFAADLDDVAPPPPEDDDLWEEPKRETVAEAAEPSFDAFLDPEPELSLTPEAEAAPKEDYLAAARRAALAHAAASSKPVKNAKAAKKSSGETPVTGLKGPGRVILWGAAGAMAAALVGGALLLRASPSEETDQANDLGPDVVGPNSAQAAQGAEAVTPDTSLFSDSPVEGAEPPIDGHSDVPLGADATTPEAHLQGTSGAQGEAQATRTVAGPVTTRNQTLQQAVAAGDAVAQYDLALQRLAANQHAEAVGLLRRSAAQGLAMAQYRLAKLYERGEGVPADLAQSRQWTERAAAGGNRRAMHDLGVFYARGEGAPLDEQAAFRWFRQAAELGVTDSQYNLGVLYQQGRGVAANASEAMFWFLVAARGGDGDARTRATALETTLTQTQADQARQRAGAFRPRAASARANGEFGARAWATRQTAQR